MNPEVAPKMCLTLNSIFSVQLSGTQSAAGGVLQHQPRKVMCLVDGLLSEERDMPKPS